MTKPEPRSELIDLLLELCDYPFREPAGEERALLRTMTPAELRLAAEIVSAQRDAARDRVLAMWQDPGSVPTEPLDELLPEPEGFEGLPVDAALMLLLQMRWPWTPGMRANVVTISAGWTDDDRRLLEERYGVVCPGGIMRWPLSYGIDGGV